MTVGTSLFSTAVPPATAAPPRNSGTVVCNSKEILDDTVTLINGVTIRVTISDDGHPSAILPAGEDYYTRVETKDLYALPAEAQNLIATGVLNPERFNVMGLLVQGDGDAESQALVKKIWIFRDTSKNITVLLEKISPSQLGWKNDN